MADASTPAPRATTPAVAPSIASLRDPSGVDDAAALPASLELLNELDAVVVDCDPVTLRPLFVSTGAEALLGFPVRDWVEDPEFWMARVHAEDRDWVLSYCRSEVDRGRSHRMEYRMIHRDGHIVWVRDHARVVCDESGQVLRVRALLVDISEFKRVEAAIRKSEEWYRSLNENSQDIVTVLSPEVIALHQSPATERLLGFRPDELVGRNMMEFIHPDDQAGVIRAMSDVIGSPDLAQTVKLRFRHKQGGWRMLESVGRNLLHDPAVCGIVVTSRDVSDREEAESRLRDSETRYRTVVASLSEGVTLVDADGRVMAINDAAARLYGVDAEQAIGQLVTDLPHQVRAEDGTPVEISRRPVFRAMSEGRTVQNMPLRIRSADGVERHVLATARPLFREGASTPHLAVASLTDVTEQRKLEEMLLQTQKMEAIGRLAGGIAHDFNNLLTAVRGYSDLLLLALEPGDPHRAHVEQIRGAGERAALLTRQLLAFGRRQQLDPQVLDVGLVLRDLQSMLRRLISEQIELRIEPGSGAVRADRGQLEQVVMNLAINARDAMPDGGTLSISTHQVRLQGDESWLVLPATPGDYVSLRVRDTGHGMDHETVQKIFEPFFTTKPPGQGTGLGLASIYGYMQQSGGSLAVVSAPGEGATFDIYLPLTAPPVAEAAPPLTFAPTAPVRGAERVLIVEDEPMVRALVSHVLAGQGYDVRTASNGDEALALAEHEGGTVDLLISDVVMPGLNGVELARRLRARWPGLQVLMMTGYSDTKLLEPGGGVADASHLLAKPFTPQDLLVRVRHLLDSAAPSRC
jgi:PAS domain S-box-containing protein